jgi:rfaE bifunctional protein kinase chain/domain/rfaE bifunctional protein nucleotidyltransferase chain/domain
VSEAAARVVRGIGERKPTIAVFGDLLLDVWSYGEASRLAREAPAPVVEVRTRREAPGGAANAAVNLAALGARTVCFGIVGTDRAGQTLLRCLKDAGVGTQGIVESDAVPTPVKHRVVCDEQVLLRLDDAPTPAPADAVDRLIERANGLEADAVLIGDYGSSTMAIAAERLRPAAPLVVVDAHDATRWRGMRPDIVTPNASEAAAALGIDPLDGDADDRAAVFTQRSADLLERTGASSLIVTLDHDGALLLGPQRPGPQGHRTRAHRVAEKNASGAGDTFVAVLTAARASGASLPDAMDAAQVAADIVVHRPGTAVCSLDDLVARVDGVHGTTLSAGELQRRVQQHRARGDRVVFTNGCFDVLHRGHTTYLRQAKDLGDVLIVAVNDDETVRRLKGPDRPVNSSRDRADVLAALECVDYVTVFTDPTPIGLIGALRPDVYVKGGDYTAEMLEEAAAVEAYGGEIVLTDYVPDHSTSGIVERIRTGVA